MKTRPFKSSDADFLNRCASQSGFPYPNLSDPLIEAVEIVVDNEDRPIAACAAKRLVELYGWFDPDQSPAVKMAAIRMLHESMAEKLRAIGYREVNISVPPSLAVRFGRRLKRSFGWRENWPSLFRNI